MLEQAAGKIHKAKPKRTHSKTLLSDKAKLKLDQLKIEDKDFQRISEADKLQIENWLES